MIYHDLFFYQSFINSIHADQYYLLNSGLNIGNILLRISKWRNEMLIKLVLAIENAKLRRYFEQTLESSDVHITPIDQSDNPWQEVVHSGCDVIVISERLIPSPIESSFSMLNDLPEKPITFILSTHDSHEHQAQLVAAGADVVLFEGASRRSLSEAVETTLASRRQIGNIDTLDSQRLLYPKLSDFTSESPSMQIFLSETLLVASSNSSLLILGETGVGKERLAKAIHAESPRASGRFVAVNTAALPEQLLESELFGHVKGAFTGAARTRRGAFELAHEGTIFLDEIGEMPLHLQSKLLRVLQDFEVKPVGGDEPISVDVRVIAATNRDLEREMKEGRFRKDLYYRLSVVTMNMPPLRDRKEDVSSLVTHFIGYFRDKIGKDVSSISESAMRHLCEYDWPGNIRELMNVIERAILLCGSNEISTVDLPTAFNKSDSSRGALLVDTGNQSSWEGKTLAEVQREVMDNVEAQYFRMLLTSTRGRVGKAAELAGIHPRGLYNKMKRLGLMKEDFK